MPNQNTPKGLQARHRKDGAKWDNTVYPVFYSSAHPSPLATGDVVVFDGTTAPNGQFRGVNVASFGANAAVSGVVEGIAGTLGNAVSSPTDSFDFWSVAGVNTSGNMSRPAGSANRDYYINISSDHNLLYAVQVSNTDVLPLTAVGQTANLEYAAPNAYTGLSAVTLNANSTAATGGQVVIYGFDSGPNNDPTQPYAKVLVYFNPVLETGLE